MYRVCNRCDIVPGKSTRRDVYKRQVTGSLPKYFDKKNYDVRVILPKYVCMEERWKGQLHFLCHFYVNLNWRKQYVGIFETTYDGITYYLVDNEFYFAGNAPYNNIYEDVEKDVYKRQEMVCLIKPQFEAGREKVGKKGVVRDKSVHEEVIDKVVSFALSIGFSVLHLEYSPIKGPEGNIEYLVHLKKEAEAEQAGVEESVDVQKVVDAAHGELDK